MTTIPIKISNQYFNIPERTSKLIYFSDESIKDIEDNSGISVNVTFNSNTGSPSLEYHLPNEPSTIYPKLKIRESKDYNLIKPLGYFPSYASLDPKQRYTYLKWLCDPSKKIDIDYVFIYYYGLERQLLYGNFDLAFEEILFLKQFHQHPSFNLYSNNAIAWSCIIKKRFDKFESIQFLFETNYFENFHFYLHSYLEKDLSTKDLLKISHRYSDINKRYIKSNPELFEEILNEILNIKFGKNYYPISLIDVSKLPMKSEILFANISLPEQDRSPEIQNFVEYEVFSKEIHSIFNDTHNAVKKTLAEDRKKK